MADRCLARADTIYLTRSENGPAVKYRAFGRTGLDISEIGFGCGNTAGLMVSGSAEQRRATVSRALDLGINYFDTAPNYGQRQGGMGTSEANLGQTLRELGARPIVGTKVEFDPETIHDIPRAVAESVEASLRRLGLDTIDVLYLHNRIGAERELRPGPMGSKLSPADVLGRRGVVDAFERECEGGRVRFVGFCTSGGDVAATRRVLEEGTFDCVQLTYNILNPTEGRLPPDGFQGADHGQFIDAAAARGLGVVVIRVLAAGALSGLAERHPVAGTRERGEYEGDLARAQTLRFLADEHEQTLSQEAIRFALAKREVSTVLVGFSDDPQVVEAVSGSDAGPLPPRDIERLEPLYRTDFGRGVAGG